MYRGLNGAEYTIIEPRIAGGGEGDIFALFESEDIVAKIFKSDRRDTEREEKIRLMVGTHLDSLQLSQIAWPLDVLYDENDEFAGYTMPYVKNTKSLTAIFDDEYDLNSRLLVAINLCATIDTLHEMGQVCGDLNPQNICVNIDKDDKVHGFQVTLVDIDSCHITYEDKTYRCEVGLADYLAPEIQKKLVGGESLKTVHLPTYTVESDLFALAVHVFTLLMNGCHPFACAKSIEDPSGYNYNQLEQLDGKLKKESVVAPQPIENIVEGFFPFSQKRDGISIPIYAPTFDSLPSEIRKFFIETFVDGYDNPPYRVSAIDWVNLLTKHRNMISQCDNGHYYFKHDEIECPFCEVEKRIIESVSSIGLVPSLDEESDEDDIDYEETSEEENLSNEYNFGSIEEVEDYYKGIFKSEPPMKKELSGRKKAFVIIGAVAAALLVLFFFKNVYTSNTTDYVDSNETVISTQNTTSNDNTNNIDSLDSSSDSDNDEVELEDTPTPKPTQKPLTHEEKIAIKGIEKIVSLIKKKDYKKAGKKAYYFSDLFDDDEDVENKYYYKNGKLVDNIKNGKGFIIYPWKSFAYYGYFKNGEPSGKGIEVGNGDNNYYWVKGTFKKGKLNGNSTSYIYNNWLGKTKYNLKITGNYKNNKENGRMTLTYYYKSGGVYHTYYCNSKNGNRTVMRYESDVGYVYAQTATIGNTYWCIGNKSKKMLKKCGHPRMCNC